MALVESRNETEIQRTATVPGRLPVRTAVGVVAAALIVAIALWATGAWSGSQTDGPASVPAGSLSIPGSERAILEQLVNRGYIPRQALESGESAREQQATVDAVKRGLVPKQALRDDAALADLVNRGLVPRQALSEKP